MVGVETWRDGQVVVLVGERKVVEVVQFCNPSVVNCLREPALVAGVVLLKMSAGSAGALQQYSHW